MSSERGAGRGAGGEKRRQPRPERQDTGAAAPAPDPARAATRRRREPVETPPTPAPTGGRAGATDGGAPGATGGVAGAGTELPEGLSGPQLARAVLEAAKARREAARGSGRTREKSPGSGRRLRGYSGSGPDPRDPQPLAVVLERLVRTRGWEQPAAEGTVFGAWDRVVGTEIASHCRPVKLTDTELTIEAESTAWATQLRLYTARILRQIASEVGPNVVTRLHIHGPAAPSWSRGQLRIEGRGPRDTYG